MGDDTITRERVLIVEDDPSLQRVLSTVLERDGLEAVCISTGGEVDRCLDEVVPDVVLLDLGLPDVNGFDLLRSIRARGSVPVIVISGRVSESDRVLGLELGADDYVVKPFLNGELVARVRVQLRRSNVDRAPAVECGLRVNRSTREVTIDGAVVELTATEFDLLAHLADSPRQVFTRDQLLDAVWNSSSDWQTEHTVTEHVRRLRRKVGDERIATVRGVGYRYEPVS